MSANSGLAQLQSEYRKFGKLYIFKRRILPYLVLLAIAIPAVEYVKDRFRIHIATGLEICLPERFFLVDLYDHEIGRNDLVFFGSDSRLEPVHESGTNIIKMAAAVSGDSISVAENRVSVTNSDTGREQVWGSLPRLDKVIEQTPLTKDMILREETLSEGEFFVIGTMPKTFDSRYWGQLNQDQIKGKAYALF